MIAVPVLELKLVPSRLIASERYLTTTATNGLSQVNLNWMSDYPVLAN